MTASRDYLGVELVYDRTITDGNVASWLEHWLLTSAGAWAANAAVRVWDPARSRRETIDLSRPGKLGEALAAHTRWFDGRHAGAVELRGATREYAILVGINDNPISWNGDSLLLGNQLCLQVMRKTVDDKPQEEFAREFLDAACRATSPMWAAMYRLSEYVAKVMQLSPSIEDIGRDFGRFLPALFAVNYFGERYVSLFGKERVAAVDQRMIEQVGSGVIVSVASPGLWQAADATYAQVLDALGREHFFDRDDRDRVTVAPDFGDSRAPLTNDPIQLSGGAV